MMIARERQTKPSQEVPDKVVLAGPCPATGADERFAICQVLHSLNVGGAEVLAYRLGKQLQERFRFVFACLDEIGTLGHRLRDDGFVVQLLERRPGFDYGCARRLSSFVRQQNVSVIHAHQYTPFAYALIPAGLRPRLPVLFTEHGRFYPDFPRQKRILFNRLLLRSRDRVVGVGQAVRQALINNEGIPARRIGVVYNGVDLKQFSCTAELQARIRRKIGVEPGDFVILQVARLDALKDHGTALRTLERVVQQRPETRLVLAGDGPELATIERQIKQRQLRPYVRLLGLRTDVPQLLAAADLFLLTSISEGIPVTLIEAMGARLPVVATDVGGVSEVVDRGRTGLLAPSGDDAALAAAVLRLIADRNSRRCMGMCGRERAAERFSERQMHTAYGQLFEEMLGVRS